MNKTYEFKFYASMKQIDPLTFDKGCELTKAIGSTIITVLDKEEVSITDMVILELKD